MVYINSLPLLQKCLDTILWTSSVLRSEQFVSFEERSDTCGRFHVTDITFREQIFGNKSFFYILLLSSFCLKFVQIFITWYLIVSIKETLILFTKAVNIFVLNSVTDITKKSTSNFTCSS